MKQEIDLRRLKVFDESGAASDIVLTNCGVNQRKRRGIFGQSETMIPHQTITTIRIEWKRLGWLCLLGLLLLVLGVLSLVFDLPSLFQPPKAPVGQLRWVPYGFFLGGFGALLCFLLYKRRRLQILSPTATIGGRILDYEEAVKFSSLVLSAVSQGADDDRRAPTYHQETKTAEEWRF